MLKTTFDKKSINFVGISESRDGAYNLYVICFMICKFQKYSFRHLIRLYLFSYLFMHFEGGRGFVCESSRIGIALNSYLCFRPCC